MKETKRYFLCGVGGSGMLPLALILKAAGHEVEGSDRALDQGRLAAKFQYLRDQGIGLHLQDGAGVVSADQIVVASAAVEDTVPDMIAARRIGATVLRRPELLAALFNAAPVRIGVADPAVGQRIKAIVARSGARKIYAAGGVRHRADLDALRGSGAAGALLASALHDKKISAGDLREIAGRL